MTTFNAREAAHAQRLTRAQRWTLVCLLSTNYCIRGVTRRLLLARRLACVTAARCSEHGGVRFISITEKGRRALGIRTTGGK